MEHQLAINNWYNPMQVETPFAPFEEPCAEEPLAMVVNNVVCTFEVGCELMLPLISMDCAHTDYRASKRVLIMKLLDPCVTAHIWSTGSINIAGATSEANAKRAAHKYTRILQKLGYPACLKKFRIVNVLGTLGFPWAVKLGHLNNKYKPICKYQPEVHPAATFSLANLNASARIFANGSINVTANSVTCAVEATAKVRVCCFEFRRERSQHELSFEFPGEMRSLDFSGSMVEDDSENEFELGFKEKKQKKSKGDILSQRSKATSNRKQTGPFTNKQKTEETSTDEDELDEEVGLAGKRKAKQSKGAMVPKRSKATSKQENAEESSTDEESTDESSTDEETTEDSSTDEDESGNKFSNVGLQQERQ